MSRPATAPGPTTTAPGDGPADVVGIDVPVATVVRWAVVVVGSVVLVVVLVAAGRAVVARVRRRRALARPQVVRAAVPGDPGRAHARCFARTSRLVRVLPAAMGGRLLGATALALAEPGGDVAVASVAQRWSVQGGSRDAHVLLALLGATAGGGVGRLVVAAQEAAAVAGEAAVAEQLAAVAEAHAGTAGLRGALPVGDVLDAAARVLEISTLPSDPLVVHDTARAWEHFLASLAPFLGPAGMAQVRAAAPDVTRPGADVVTRLAGVLALARDRVIDMPRVGGTSEVASLPRKFAARGQRRS